MSGEKKNSLDPISHFCAFFQPKIERYLSFINQQLKKIQHLRCSLLFAVSIFPAHVFTTGLFFYFSSVHIQDIFDNLEVRIAAYKSLCCKKNLEASPNLFLIWK